MIERAYQNPTEIIDRKSHPHIIERVRQFFTGKSFDLTDTTIKKLQSLDTVIFLFEENNYRQLTLNDAMKYLEYRFQDYESRYPTGFKYNKIITAELKSLARLKKALSKNEFAPIIVYFLEKSEDEWRLADRSVGRLNDLKDLGIDSDSLKETWAAHRKESTNADPGIPDFEMDINGERARFDSQRFLVYAALFAKRL